MCKVEILQVDLCQTQHLHQGPKVITPRCREIVTVTWNGYYVWMKVFAESLHNMKVVKSAMRVVNYKFPSPSCWPTVTLAIYIRTNYFNTHRVPTFWSQPLHGASHQRPHPPTSPPLQLNFSIHTNNRFHKIHTYISGK